LLNVMMPIYHTLEISTVSPENLLSFGEAPALWFGISAALE